MIPKPSEAELKRAVEVGEEKAKIAALSPTKHEVVEALGPEGYEEKPNGEWGYKLHDEKMDRDKALRRRKIYEEMSTPWRKKVIERSYRESAKIPTISVEMKDGSRREVPAYIENQIKKQGAKPVIKWGRPSQKYMNGRWWERRGNEWIEQDES